MDIMAGIPGNDNQVFIIRIRVVPREIQGEAPVLRGEIEHLNTTRRAFLKNLNEIILFIQPVLEEMGLESTGPPVILPGWLIGARKFLAGVFPRRKS